jgi:hypothetical protein
MVSNLNSKEEIIQRFNNREIVQTYFKYIKVSNSQFYDKIKGIYNEIKEDITDLFNLYGIKEVLIESETKYDYTSWGFDCYQLKEGDMDRYMPLFFREFSLYPISLIEKSQIKSIVFCNSLDFYTDHYRQYRAAVPDYGNYENFSMVYCAKESSVSYIKNVIHHEFFHMLDYVHDWKIYGPDPDWEECNTPDFKYGTGGANNRSFKELDGELRGFISQYSTTGIEEDKAEIFAHMINFPVKAFINNTCVIVENKIKLIKNVLKELDPLGSGQEEFWDNLSLMRLE